MIAVVPLVRLNVHEMNIVDGPAFDECSFDEINQFPVCRALPRSHGAVYRKEGIDAKDDCLERPDSANKQFLAFSGTPS